jgi:two-component system, sensor histidine kinase ChiS
MRAAFACAVLFFASAAAAGEPERSPAQAKSSRLEPTVRFDCMSVDEGLPSVNVEAFAQDRTGFMWIGTEDGLARYDGHRFNAYSAGEKLGDQKLSGSHVTALFAAADGSLWVAFADGGLDHYDPASHKLEIYKNDPSNPQTISSDSLIAIAGDKQGRIWLGTNGAGVNRLDPKSGTITRWTSEQGLSGDTVLALAIDRSGAVWVGTDGGLDVLDADSGKVIKRGAELKIGAVMIRTLHESRTGDMWIGTTGYGVYRYVPKTGAVTSYLNSPDDPASLSDDRVSAILESADGTVWIGTQQLLNRFLSETGKFIRHEPDPRRSHTINSNWIRSIFEDAEGVLWFGGFGGGLCKTHPTRAHLGLYDIGQTGAILEDSEGHVWFGSDLYALSRLNRKTGQLTSFNTEERWTEGWIIALAQAKDGAIWFSGHDMGLFRFDPRALVFERWTADSDREDTLGTNTINTIVEAPDGTLWLGTWGGGIESYDPTSKTFERYTKEDGLESDHVYSLMFAKREPDVLWAGTAESGLVRFDTKHGKFKVFKNDPTNPKSLSHDRVVHTYEDEEGAIWVATWDGGLNRFDPATGNAVRYGLEVGLPSLVIYGVHSGGGALWLSTTRGLARFDPKTGRAVTLGPADGLQGLEFSQTGHARGDSGALLFGGAHGFNVFRPEAVPKDDRPPPVVLTRFQVLNEDVPLPASSGVPHVRLSYKEPVFSFEFAALSYASPDKNRFAYDLEPLHGKINAGEKHFVTYANLEPGDYVLRVQGSNHHGTWNTQGTSIAIHIDPPPWRTWWAYSLYALFLLALLAAYLRYQEERVERLRAGDRIVAMQRERAALERSNRELDAFASVASHDLQEPLRKVRAFSELLIEECGPQLGTNGPEYLKRIMDAVGRMQALIRDLLEYSRVSNTRQPITMTSLETVIQEVISDLDVTISEAKAKVEVGTLPAIEADPLQMRQLLQNLLSNAIKYRKDDEAPIVRVKSKTLTDRPEGAIGEPPFVELRVQDNGIGFDEKHTEKIFAMFQRLHGRGSKYSGTGLGLATCARIVQRHGGVITAKSSPGQGATFIVILPTKHPKELELIAPPPAVPAEKKPQAHV